MSLFISGMINGAGRMEAESTKDSFGWMTHFYLQAVNYCPATECKCVVENRFLVSLSIGQKRRWCVCVCVSACVRVHAQSICPRVCLRAVWVESMHF